MNHKLTYRQLRDFLNKLQDQELNCDVTIAMESNEDEFFPATLYFASKDCDRLDENHPFLMGFDASGIIAHNKLSLELYEASLRHDGMPLN